MRKCFFLIAMSFIILSCSSKSTDDDNGDDSVNYVSDAESLMSAIEIPGATIKNGNVPVPTGIPSDNIESMPNSIIVTSNSVFNVPIKLNTTEARVPRLVFIQLEGSSHYYQIELDVDGNPVEGKGSFRNKSSIIAGGEFNCHGKRNIKLKGGAYTPEKYTNKATVRTYSPPVAVPLDTSWMEDIKFWSKPKEINFECFDVGTGDIQISLTWDTQSDVDIWLTEPDGNKIYYANPISSSGGELDYDNVFAYGPENIFYKNEAPSGTYKVEVNYYDGAPKTTYYSVMVKNGNAINTFSGVLNSYSQTNFVTEFTK